ncbi:MAG: sulfurtransferase [Halothiobacillaceae bacterium]|nr:sulfurtransferase [Halothiobacillaceae bacterium]
MNTLAPLVQAAVLLQPAARLGWVLIDMREAADYQAGHIPGARQLDFSDIVAERPPVAGLLPDPVRFAARMRELGIDAHARVLAYDDCGGLKACRLLWTLGAYGVSTTALLDGGWQSWIEAGGAVETLSPAPTPAHGPALSYLGRGVRDAQAIRSYLGRPDRVLLDARSPEEYSGEDRRSRHGGHIPGAVNYEWSRALQGGPVPRFRPLDTLRQELALLGVTPDKEVIAYCQTHRRSCVSVLMLRALGFTHVYGYPGAWSDWGNRDDLPRQP